MIPFILYESLPVLYLSLGILLIGYTDLPLLLFAGMLFYISGAVITILRSANRRTDDVSMPRKKLLLPNSLYEFMPFIQIVCGICILRCVMLTTTLVGSVLLLQGAKHLMQRRQNRKCYSPVMI